MSSLSPKLLRLIVIAVTVCLVILVLPSVRQVLGVSLLGITEETLQFTLDVLQIGMLAILFAALLAPLEALGWWAGWYGDEVETVQAPGSLIEPLPSDRQISRYVVYLDGISQAQFEYLPEVEKFLDELAADLPNDIVLIKGIIPYSVLNQPLTENRLLSFFWRMADRFQMTASGGIFGALIGATINIRNILIVSVAADQRYGPIYNRGTAQIIHNSLANYGYERGSRIPITLLGYSGGAQMAIGAAPYLKRALRAPVEVISLSGVMSGNHNVLELEHLYHLVGDRDFVEKEGPILFGQRWKIAFLSYWNRAKKRGKISFISLGPVGHNGKGGPYDAEARLPDGRTHLQQTIEMVSGIIQGISPLVPTETKGKPSNYERYWRSPYNQPETYPLDQTVDERYRAIAPWIGRLILPTLEQRRRMKGIWFEVHHAPEPYQHLIGQVLNLRWSDDPSVKIFLRNVIRDVHFSAEAKHNQKLGSVHPQRLDHWQRVDPLESLAGSRPHDDVIVALDDPQFVEVPGLPRHDPAPPLVALTIRHEPVQITGRFYALVKFIEPVGTEDFRVVHFNRATREFDGSEEVVCLPQVVADVNGCCPSTRRDIERTEPNAAGWYIYGAKDGAGVFVVQAIAPRSLLRVQPEQVILGQKESWHYLKKESWQVQGQKGKTHSVLLVAEDSPAPDAEEMASAQAVDDWQEGDRALVIHTYGGIGGKKREPAAKTPLFFGHFAYGVARVVREPLADELMFDIRYYQVYTHNVDGIIAGTLAWNRFMGDRQFGWMGTRPVSDLLVRHIAFTENYQVRGRTGSPLDALVNQLQEMTARYRIGDGTGGTYVGFAHNCAQDSNQAFYTTIKGILDLVHTTPEVQELLALDPEQTERLEELVKLGDYIKRKLLPFGSARADWEDEDQLVLGISPEDRLFRSIFTGLLSWRTMLPRLASETIAKQFIKQGAQIWVLRTNQVGGYDPDIEPIAPTPIG